MLDEGDFTLPVELDLYDGETHIGSSVEIEIDFRWCHDDGDSFVEITGASIAGKTLSVSNFPRSYRVIDDACNAYCKANQAELLANHASRHPFDDPTEHRMRQTEFV